MRLRIVVLSLFGVLNLGAAAQTVVPFRLIDGWAIVLEGTLAGRPRQKMLIDTGAVPSVINLRLARQLGLSGPTQDFSLINKAINVERVTIKGVQVGIIAVEALEMVAVDLEAIERALNTRIDAVIGLDVLSRQNFRLDYGRKELVFLKDAVTASAIPFEIMREAGGAYILIPLKSNGETLRMLLDTGTKDIMLFKGRLAVGLQQIRVRGKDTNVNPGGQDSLDAVELESTELGPFAWKTRKAYLWAIPQQQLHDFDGMMGPAAFDIQVIAFDFDRHMISLKIPRSHFLQSSALGAVNTAQH